MRKMLAVFIATFMLVATSAHAAGLTWTLNDWTYSDGATGSGSFDYDASTDMFSNILINVSGGSEPDRVYNTIGSASSAQSLFFFEGSFADFTGETSLAASLSSAMTNAGGVIPALIFTNLGEQACLDATCTTGSLVRAQTSGSISAIPLPASVLLLGSALLGLGLLRRRQTA
ncbi:MAG: VPLPA-CTERM sorting domain-containing protein [Pseudomonadota bacterium]